MTVKEAQKLMKTAPCSETKKSRMNPSFSQAQMHKIVQDWLDGHETEKGPDAVLDNLFEKRVYQIVKNQRRPRF